MENNQINGELSENEFAVLTVFKTNKNALKDEIVIKTKLSSRTIGRIIKSSKEKGLLRRVGSNKT